MKLLKNGHNRKFLWDFYGWQKRTHKKKEIFTALKDVLTGSVTETEAFSPLKKKKNPPCERIPEENLKKDSLKWENCCTQEFGSEEKKFVKSVSAKIKFLQLFFVRDE